MSNTVPYEVLAAPGTVWFATPGTAFPVLGVAPSVSWTKVGTSGPLNYDGDAGLVIEHRQENAPWRSLGDAGSRKVFRSSEDQILRLTLVDITLEQYRLAVNRNAVTDVPAGVGTVGYRKLGLSRGFTVDTMAVLVRFDASPYGADFTMQYEFPIMAQQGSPQVTFLKDRPAGLILEFMSLVDPSQTAAEYFGRLVMQDDEANT